MNKIQQFREDLCLDFLESFEKKEKDIELWAMPELTEKGVLFIDFTVTLDKTFDYIDREGHKVLVCSMHYLRPLCLYFHGYDIKLTTDKRTGIVRTLRVSF